MPQIWSSAHGCASPKAEEKKPAACCATPRTFVPGLDDHAAPSRKATRKQLQLANAMRDVSKQTAHPLRNYSGRQSMPMADADTESAETSRV